MQGYRTSGIAIVLVALGLFALYLIGTSENFIYADDSLPFATRLAMERPIEVHHLALTVIDWANDQLGFEGEASLPKSLWLLRAYVAAMAFVALLLVGLLALRWCGTAAAALRAMLFVAFTFGFWSYAIVPDFYVPAAAWALLAIYSADRALEADGRRRTHGLLALSGLCVLGAALNHQAYALVFIPLVVVLLLGRRLGSNPLLRARHALGYTVLVAAAGLAIYYGAYRAADPDVGFFTYIRGFSAYMLMPAADTLQPLTPLYALVGVGRTVVFTEYFLSFDAMYDKAHAAFPTKMLLDDRFLIREIPDVLVVVLCVLVLVVFALLAALALRTIYVIARTRVFHPGYWIVLGWVVVQTVFFAWWEPTSTEFWIWLMPCLGLLGTALFVRRQGPRLWPVLSTVLIAALLLVNLPAVSRYWSASNCLYRVNKSYLTRLDPDDLVIGAGIYPMRYFQFLDGRVAKYHSPHHATFVFDNEDLRGLLEETARAGGRVFLDPMLAMPTDEEIEAGEFLMSVPREEVEKDLLRLERYCRDAGLPLYGVVRRGLEERHVEKRAFGGYLQWIEY